MLDLPRPRLVGRHQYINAGTAIAALRAAGFEQFETSAFEAGLHPCGLAGAFAAHRQGPPPGARSRGLANSGSTAATMPMAAGCWRPPWRIKASATISPLVLIVGMLGTKDSDAFFRNFIGLAREVIAVPISGQIAARPADEVASIAASVGLTTSVQASVEIRAGLAAGFRMGAATAHPGLRIALSRGGSAGRQRNAAAIDSPPTRKKGAVRPLFKHRAFETLRPMPGSTWRDRPWAQRRSSGRRPCRP